MIDQARMLTSWKEIAAYLRRTVRTCQRLEATMGLPVHRLDGSPKAHVFAYASELDAWLAGKAGERDERRKPRRLGLYLGAALTAVAAAAVILAAGLGGRKAERSIAVLHENLSRDPGWDYVADGIAEDVSNALMQVRGFRVPGRISAAVLGDRELDIPGAGRMLDVENVLKLSVQIAGESLRVHAQLIRVKDGFQRWADKLDLPMGDILAVENQITRAILDQLKVVLLPGEATALNRRPTADSEAYYLYLKGRFLLGRPKPEAPWEALRLFEAALERDPAFAPAHVGIAWVHMNMISQFLARPTEAGPKAAEEAKKALALDPGLAEAHALNAWVEFLYDFDWAAAAKSFARALELKPGDAMIRGMHAYFLLPGKRFEEARAEIRSAIALDPLMPELSAYSLWIHLYTGRYEEVLEESLRVRRIDPDLEFAYSGAGLAHFGLGHIDESIAMFNKARGLPHSNGRPEAGLAAAFLKKGDRAAAEALYGDLVEEWERYRRGSAFNLAWLAAALGDTDGVFVWLNAAIDERDPMAPIVQVLAERRFPAIARDPRFRAVLDRLGLPF